MINNYNRLHIDVGANDGKAAIGYARYEPLTRVIAFEPVPKLVEHIKSQTSNLKNFTIIQAAVSDFDGVDLFKVSAQSETYGDYACSSLLEFSNNSKTEWGDRNDLKVVDEILVKVTRLDTFFIENDITKVDYLKIDTQGNDLNVLKGCGDLLPIIHKGELEAANKDDILYKGQNTKFECIEFLVKNGFKILSVNYNDEFQNEVNIVFENMHPKKIKYKKTIELYD